MALFDPESKSLFTGDTLFRESIGRTDLPGGDYSWIMRSILDSLIPLGEEVRVYPGHGPESTIGHEMLYNPFRRRGPQPRSELQELRLRLDTAEDAVRENPLRKPPET